MTTPTTRTSRSTGALLAPALALLPPFAALATTFAVGAVAHADDATAGAASDGGLDSTPADESASTEASGAPVVPAGWTLTFRDEFDGPAIDVTKWQFRFKWGEAVINNEQEAYVSSANAGQAFTFDNGIMHITARKQPGTYGGMMLPYTSGLLASKYEQKFGYFETRCKMPKGQGLWPAFWLNHAVKYPDIHEIDIHEWLSRTPTIVYQTDHWGTDYAKDSHQQQFTLSGPDFSDDFHTFGVDWQSTKIVWYVDGQEQGRTEDPAELQDVEMYVITNLAVGGAWPGNPGADAVFPASYDVDYIRVFQRDGSLPGVSPPFGGAGSGGGLPDAGGTALGNGGAAGDASAGMGAGGVLKPTGHGPGCCFGAVPGHAPGPTTVGVLLGLGLVARRRRR